MSDETIVISAEEFPAALGRLAQHYGGVSALARRFKVDRSNLDKAIRGKRGLSPALLTRKAQQ